MKTRRLSAHFAGGLALAAALLISLAAQAERPYKAPRGPDGKHPDLNGVWQALNTANYDLEFHHARFSMQERQGPHGPLPSVETVKLGTVGTVPPGLGVIKGGGNIPYKPEALTKKQENQANWLERDPEIKCYLPGVPRATYMPYPFQIFQGQDDVFIAYQYAGAVRDIYMKDPGEAPIDTWMGQSFGRWEKDTLVVEVTGLNDQTWFDRSGNHHSDQLKVVERYTPMSANHIRYEATITDPATFMEPWTITMPLYRRMESDIRLMDFKCVQFVEELLYGEWRRTPLERP